MQKFQVIVSDCPFGFSDSLNMSSVKRGAKANYNTMSIKELKDLPIKDIADPDGAILAFWVPSSLLVEGLEIMNAWGFKQKQTYIWVKRKKTIFSEFTKLIKKSIKLAKTNKFTVKSVVTSIIDGIQNLNLNTTLAFGMGRLFRQAHEICLIGTNNNKIYKSLSNKSQRSVCIEQNFKHSKKPENLQDSLDVMFSGSNINKIEIFSRRLRPGWTCIGNEVCNGEDIRDSLAKL